jgi:hypothetical protein
MFGPFKGLFFISKVDSKAQELFGLNLLEWNEQLLQSGIRDLPDVADLIRSHKKSGLNVVETAVMCAGEFSLAHFRTVKILGVNYEEAKKIIGAQHFDNWQGIVSDLKSQLSINDHVWEQWQKMLNEVDLIFAEDEGAESEEKREGDEAGKMLWEFETGDGVLSSPANVIPARSAS